MNVLAEVRIRQEEEPIANSVSYHHNSLPALLTRCPSLDASEPLHQIELVFKRDEKFAPMIMQHTVYAAQTQLGIVKR